MGIGGAWFGSQPPTVDILCFRKTVGAAQQVPPFFALSGKKATPMDINRQVNRILAGREIQKTLDKLAQSGSQARYISADVSDGKAVSGVLELVRKDWGDISGIIHAAGVLKDKAIVDMEPEQFELVYRTKVSGLKALLTATESDDLKLLCCFSSIAPRVGNPGQLNYNVANFIARSDAWGGAESESIFTAAQMFRRRVQESALKALNRGMELMGSAGYAKEWHEEKHWRDIKTIQSHLCGVGADVPVKMDIARFFYGSREIGHVKFKEVE